MKTIERNEKRKSAGLKSVVTKEMLIRKRNQMDDRSLEIYNIKSNIGSTKFFKYNCELSLGCNVGPKHIEEFQSFFRTK